MWEWCPHSPAWRNFLLHSSMLCKVRWCTTDGILFRSFRRCDLLEILMFSRGYASSGNLFGRRTRIICEKDEVRVAIAGGQFSSASLRVCRLDWCICQRLSWLRLFFSWLWLYYASGFSSCLPVHLPDCSSGRPTILFVCLADLRDCLATFAVFLVPSTGLMSFHNLFYFYVITNTIL